MADHKILIVEDEERIAQDIWEMLEQLGYQVAGVTDSGEKALKIVAETGPDLTPRIVHTGESSNLKNLDLKRKISKVSPEYTI